MESSAAANRRQGIEADADRCQDIDADRRRDTDVGGCQDIDVGGRRDIDVGVDRRAGARPARGYDSARAKRVGISGERSDASNLGPSELHAFREHALARGVNPLLYWIVRAVLLPFFLLYFRLERTGRERIPASGPVLLAANHRSFLDPFAIGALTRRPVYYVAKRELFERRWQAWLLNSLGAFPIDRGAGDQDAMATARTILNRGDCVVIFPEGTRIRTGPLGDPHRGVGRLALQTGARVVPVAVMGTEGVRRGWRIRPHKIRLRCGRPLSYPSVEEPSQAIALGVAQRIWASVSLQWEWLGGTAFDVGEQFSDQASGRETRAA